MTYREEEAARLREKIETDAAIDDTGLLRWSMGNAVPAGTWKDAYGRPMPAALQKRYDEHTSAVIAKYVKSQKGREVSAEERFEMRAAFGPGTEVVNVFTGRKVRV
jgi:hypothetical protein